MDGPQFCVPLGKCSIFIIGTLPISIFEPKKPQAFFNYIRREGMLFSRTWILFVCWVFFGFFAFQQKFLFSTVGILKLQTFYCGTNFRGHPPFPLINLQLHHIQ